MGFHVDRFAKATGAAPATDVRTGYGFEPTGCMAFATRQTATGVVDHNSVTIGQSDGSSHFAVAMSSEDDVANSNIAGRNRSKLLSFIDESTGSVVAECTVAFDADGLTFTWDTNDANAYHVTVMAWGGDHEVVRKTFNAQTSTGNQTVSSLGFADSNDEPECLIFIWSILDTDPPSGGVGNSNIGYGWAVGTGSEDECAFVTYAEDNVAGSDTGGSNKDDRCIQEMHNKGGDPTEGGGASFVSVGADQFTINWDTVANTAFRISVLAIRGGRYSSQQDASPTSGVAPVSQSLTGAGFNPNGLLFGHRSSTNWVGMGAGLGVGAASDPAEEGNIYLFDLPDTGGNTQCSQAVKNDKTTTNRDGLLGDPITIAEEAELTAFDSDGSTFSWDPRNNLAIVYGVLFFADAAIANRRRSMAQVI